MTAWMFWLCFALLIYCYIGYPLLLLLVSGVTQLWRDNRYLLGHAERRQSIDDAPLPAVTVVIAAYNEEACLAARIENVLTQDYPADRLHILIGSDGSQDGTAAILQAQTDARVSARIFSENRGKVSVLNELLAEVETPLVVMTDANTRFATDAVRRLVRGFTDAEVGAVCGDLRLVDRAGGNNRDGVYWRYERLLKFHESRLNALLGANGAIYAIRRALYQPLPGDTVVDDYQIAMQVVQQGYLLKYDPEAIAEEDSAPDLQAEMGRRVRIGMGNYQAFFRNFWLLQPSFSWRFVSYLSHKVLRWFAPHLMLLCLISNALLLGQGFYTVLFALQLLFYGIAWQGLRRQATQQPVVAAQSIVVFFVSMNLSLLRGFFRYLRHGGQGRWERTAR